MMGNTPGTIDVPATFSGSDSPSDDPVVDETAVALVYNGISHVVMMATATDLEDFALGFSLSEGILSSPDQLYGVSVHAQPLGLEVRLEVASAVEAALKERRRNLAGRTGCGLCGAESLEQAISVPQPVQSSLTVPPAAFAHAVTTLTARQPLRDATGASHGAAFCSPSGEVLCVREDVGRHNALDKLLGALQCEHRQDEGFVLVTSRASYEMVAKTAAANIPVLAAVSAPTSLAVEHAQRSGLTLVARVSERRHTVYTHPNRVSGAAEERACDTGN